ncbi:MAG: glycogen debranching protein [Clostridia bacterium]|jgi:predicted glycogen debranching enzyme|nr:glycogen debranching protein [Clostridia bacterium]
MKFNKKDIELKNGLTKEWIITNGIGGFAAQSILGINTRKYHGLLVAPLVPPARRYVVLSKIDESFIIEGQEKIIYSNLGKNYISEGYKNLESFEKTYNPIFKYNIENKVKIEKQVVMVYGKNTTCIVYKVENKTKENILMKLATIMNFRDFHCMSTNHEYNIEQKIQENKIRVIVDGNKTTPVYIFSKEGKYIEHHNDIFKNMFYIEEEKRGFFPEEDLFIPGRYEIEIKPEETKEFTIVCSLEENIEEIDGKKIIKQEEKRLQKIIDKSELVDEKKTKAEQEKMRDLVIASDNFVAYRPQFSLHTIIAGFPWFLDWGRDTLIAFEGLLLKTKRYDIAKEVLLMMTRDIKFGLIPNGYSGYDSRPLYNSVDSSLLLFEQINKYLEYTNDIKFVKKEMYNILLNIIEMFQKGIDIDDSNIYMDKDNLISAGTENTQLTWMDAKVSNFAVTPRNGKAVEINALWYNALKTVENLAKEFKDEKTKKEVSDLAKKVKANFNKKFYNEKSKCLYDVLGSEEIRPNQLFALSTTYPVMILTNEKAKETLKTITKELYTKYGLATLSSKDKKYVAIYEGDSFKRDMSYHQGITWPWLSGIYIAAFKTIIKNEKNKTEKKKLEEEYEKIIKNYKTNFTKAMKESGIGSISEVYDSKPPYNPGGCFTQGWSVSETIKIMLEE